MSEATYLDFDNPLKGSKRSRDPDPPLGKAETAAVVSQTSEDSVHTDQMTDVYRLKPESMPGVVEVQIRLSRSCTDFAQPVWLSLACDGTSFTTYESG